MSPNWVDPDYEHREIVRMAEALSKVCKCKHALLAHSFRDNNPNQFWCNECQCKHFVQMSNMEWLVYQAEQRKLHKRFLGWLSYLIYRMCKQIKKFFV